jgi:hypothetical protein
VLNWVVYMTAMGTLALVFLVSVSHKLRDYSRFKASLGAYRLFPQPLLKIVAPIVVALELAAVVAILLPSGPGKWLAFGLLTIYTGALAVNLARGNTSIDCGCGDAPTPISGWLLLRNGALLLLALPFESAAVDHGIWQWGLVVMLVIVLVFYYLVVEQLLANQHVLNEDHLPHGQLPNG